MKSVMVGWSSLSDDLIRRVGDCMLATNDIDYYMDLRAVCCSWRTATTDPCQPGADAGLFRPRHWAMLHADSKDEHRRFLNLSTGRLLRRHLPLLRDHAIINTSDGLVILGDRKNTHAALILNPLTGSMIHFAIPVPQEDIIKFKVASLGAMLAFYTYNGDGDVLWCVDPATQTFSRLRFPPERLYIQSMIAYAGNVYISEMFGLFKIVGTVHPCSCEQIAKFPVESAGSDKFLVESAGDLLLIHKSYKFKAFEIFRVDVQRNMVEAVKSIGSRALFLGPRSMSVDADKFPSLDDNCLYYHYSLESEQGMYMYNLKDGRESTISKLRWSGNPSRTKCVSVRPMSLVQLLLGCSLSNNE